MERMIKKAFPGETGGAGEMEKPRGGYTNGDSGCGTSMALGEAGGGCLQSWVSLSYAYFCALASVHSSAAQHGYTDPH
jgi:hypothetical protein